MVPAILTWGGVYSVDGKIQKGPFTQGTSITIQALDDKLNPTGKNYHTQTTDDAGSFHINNQIESRYVEIIASGYYFNEVSGRISTSPITLRSLSDLTEEGKANVNLLTTLETERIRTLVLRNGKTMHEARQQAERELFALFHIPENSNVSCVFDKMDITREGEANAILLAISATLQEGRSEGVLSELISKIASEISESGWVENENIREQIRQNGMSVNAESVRNNLEDRYSSLGISGYVIPPFEDYLDINGNGVIDKNDSWLILNKKDFVLSSDGGIIELEVQHNVDLEVIIEDDEPDNDWITLNETKAYLETNRLSFIVTKNETYDERVASIILRDRTSGYSEAVYVIQKQLDALTVSASRFEVPTSGGRVQIDVKANVNYSVEIPDDCKSWIRIISTKSLSSYHVILDIPENFETKTRHGEVVISDGNLSETIDIYQTGESRLLLDKKDHTISSDGAVITIEVSSNFDYEVVMPQVDWLSEIGQTKALATGTRTFRVEPNETYDDRYAEIVFRDKNGSKEEKATIYQTQKNAVIIARDVYDISNEGGDITVEIQANMPFQTSILSYCQTWIIPVPDTKALTKYAFKYKIMPHEDYNGRSGEIKIWGNNISKFIKINQGAKGSLELDNKTYNVAAEGGNVWITYQTNLTCHCIYANPEDESWLKLVPETKGIQSYQFVFSASPNESYSSRKAELVIESEDGKYRESVVVIQAQKGALNIGQTEYAVPYVAGELDVEVESSIDYQIDILEGDDWLSVVPKTKALEISVLKLAYTKNESYVERIGKLRVYDSKNRLETILTVTQAPNGDTRVVHVETPGTLAEIVDFEELRNVRSLKLTGTVSQTDLAKFDNNGHFLTETLDLRDLTVIGGTINTFGYTRGPTLSTTIGSFAKLKTVYLSPTVKTLGSDAFHGCSSLENVIFGENSQLASIEGKVKSDSFGGYLIRGAFSYCDNLKSIVLPASLKNLHGGAFYSCTSLESVTFEEGCNIKTLKGDNYSYGGNLGMLAYSLVGLLCNCPALKHFEIPASVETLGAGAFSGASGLSSIVIPETVKHFDSDRMFDGCTSLESVSLPSGVKEFGYAMFRGCSNLKEIKCASAVDKVGDYTFQGCSAMTEIALGNFSSIGKGAFSKSGIVSIRIPDAMTELPGELFLGCNGLTDVDLNKVKKIGAEAFQECKSLESITIPKTIEFIGSYAFGYCENLKKFKLEGGNRIVLDHSILARTKVREFVIPAEVVSIVSESTNYGPLASSEIYSIVFEENSKCEEFGIAGGSGITSIVLPSSLKTLTPAAFLDCKYLSDVRLPENLQSICNSAFKGCLALDEIELPASVDTLDMRCFANSALESIVIPEGVKYVGERAFESCSSLSTISLPNTLEFIGSNVFYDCMELKPFVLNGAETLTCRSCPLRGDEGHRSPYINKIVFGKNIKRLQGDFFGCPVMVEFEDGAKLEEIDKKFFMEYKFSSIDLPSTVRTIGASAFEDSKITEFICPASLISLGDYAFQNSALTKITFNEGLQSIGYHCFYGCTGLQYVTLQSENLTSAKECFSGCRALENVTISEGVTTLPLRIFYNCKGLKKVTLPSTLTSISESSFESCTGLQNISLPSSLISIGSSAFSGCTALQRLTLQSDLSSASVCFGGCTALEEVIVSEGVTILPSSIFNGCSGLKEVSLPSTLTSIGSSAFKGCAALQNISLPSSLISIGSYAFSSCTGLQNISLPSSLISIGSSAFSSCTGLQNISLPSSLTSIGSSAFKGCAALQSINLPSSLTSIESYAFSGCGALKTVTISEGITTLPDYVFEKCTGLQEVTLPKSLTSMGSVFRGCTGLQRLTLQSDLSSASRIFSSCTALETVVVSEGVTILPSSIFNGCAALQSISLPSTLTSIESSAFRDCAALQSMTLPSSLTSIGDSAFSGCEALETVLIPESVTSIKRNAFENTAPHIVWNMSSNEIIANEPFSGCSGILDIGGYGVPYLFYEKILSGSGLSEINLLDGIKTIGGHAFAGMKEPVTFTIPDSVVDIKVHAFSACTFQSDVMLPSSLEEIGNYAFYGCAGLSHLIIPSTVTAIGKSAFMESSVKEVRIESIVPAKLDSYSSYYLPFDTVNQPAIYVPAAALEVYKAATGWKDYELQGF